MDRLMDLKGVKIMADVISLLFLGIHIVLFFLFRYYAVEPMMYFNIFSMIFYVLMFPVIHRNMLRTFVLATYFEVVLHMTLAACFTGWSSGFQVTLIGMSILLYYSEYLGRYIKVPCVRSTPVCLIGVSAYLISCVLNFRFDPAYPLPREANFLLQFSWGVIVFVINMFFLAMFVQVATRSDALLSDNLRHDQLTGLPNRYFLLEYLRNEHDAGSLDGRWMAMVDIDNFKSINDTYGHNCGDYVLKQVAMILLGDSDNMVACRWGGEEFLLIGKVKRDAQRQIDELNVLRKAIMKHHFEYEGQPLDITITIGAAVYADDATIQKWIDRADQNMYRGKTGGKNMVVA